MRIGAYQFDVTANIDNNFIHIKEGIDEASKSGVRLLVFPECAVTGYPPRCIEHSSDVDFEKVSQIHEKLQILAEESQVYIVTGTIVNDESHYYNSAVVFSPDGKREKYCKRALWGWDKENFAEGQDKGVIKIDSLRVGIRICFEVRFPEYFRELYNEHTDLNLILFYDVSDNDDVDRFNMIKGHIQTRAVENVCPILTCNTCTAFQTAPTGVFDRSGKISVEMPRGKEGLMFYDLEQKDLDFGEQGRKIISDSLIR